MSRLLMSLLFAAAVGVTVASACSYGATAATQQIATAGVR